MKGPARMPNELDFALAVDAERAQLWVLAEQDADTA
jgi:hypothetical protein